MIASAIAALMTDMEKLETRLGLASRISRLNLSTRS
jgi:hypothetical protein